LKAPDVPSVLIELGYLSNPTDERLLRRDDYRRKLAGAIARAIDSYFVRFEARNRH
jgi:N-acetylmuramoyl-L-alanine amidase